LACFVVGKTFLAEKQPTEMIMTLADIRKQIAHDNIVVKTENKQLFAKTAKNRCNFANFNKKYFDRNYFT